MVVFNAHCSTDDLIKVGTLQFADFFIVGTYFREFV